MTQTVQQKLRSLLRSQSNIDKMEVFVGDKLISKVDDAVRVCKQYKNENMTLSCIRDTNKRYKIFFTEKGKEISGRLLEDIVQLPKALAAASKKDNGISVSCLKIDESTDEDGMIISNTNSLLVSRIQSNTAMRLYKHNLIDKTIKIVNNCINIPVDSNYPFTDDIVTVDYNNAVEVHKRQALKFGIWTLNGEVFISNKKRNLIVNLITGASSNSKEDCKKLFKSSVHYIVGKSQPSSEKKGIGYFIEESIFEDYMDKTTYGAYKLYKGRTGNFDFSAKVWSRFSQDQAPSVSLGMCKRYALYIGTFNKDFCDGMCRSSSEVMAELLQGKLGYWIDPVLLDGVFWQGRIGLSKAGMENIENRDIDHIIDKFDSNPISLERSEITPEMVAQIAEGKDGILKMKGADGKTVSIPLKNRVLFIGDKTEEVAAFFDDNTMKIGFDYSRELEYTVLRYLKSTSSNFSATLLSKMLACDEKATIEYVTKKLEGQTEEKVRELLSTEDMTKRFSSISEFSTDKKSLFMDNIVSDLYPDRIKEDVSLTRNMINQYVNSLSKLVNSMKFKVDGKNAGIIVGPEVMLGYESIVGNGEIYAPSIKKFKEALLLKYPTMGLKEYGLFKNLKLKEIIKRVRESNDILEKDKDMIIRDYKNKKFCSCVVPASELWKFMLAGSDFDTDQNSMTVDKEIIRIIKKGHVTEAVQIIDEPKPEDGPKDINKMMENLKDVLGSEEQYTIGMYGLGKTIDKKTKGREFSVGQISNWATELTLYRAMLLGNVRSEEEKQEMLADVNKIFTPVMGKAIYEPMKYVKSINISSFENDVVIVDRVYQINFAIAKKIIPSMNGCEWTITSLCDYVGDLIIICRLYQEKTIDYDKHYFKLIGNVIALFVRNVVMKGMYSTKIVYNKEDESISTEEGYRPSTEHKVVVNDDINVIKESFSENLIEVLKETTEKINRERKDDNTIFGHSTPDNISFKRHLVKFKDVYNDIVRESWAAREDLNRYGYFGNVLPDNDIDKFEKSLISKKENEALHRLSNMIYLSAVQNNISLLELGVLCKQVSSSTSNRVSYSKFYLKVCQEAFLTLLQSNAEGCVARAGSEVILTFGAKVGDLAHFEKGESTICSIEDKSFTGDLTIERDDNGTLFATTVVSDLLESRIRFDGQLLVRISNSDKSVQSVNGGVSTLMSYIMTNKIFTKEVSINYGGNFNLEFNATDAKGPRRIKYDDMDNNALYNTLNGSKGRIVSSTFTRGVDTEKRKSAANGYVFIDLCDESTKNIRKSLSPKKVNRAKIEKIVDTTKPLPFN